jgi:hypothetical protein
VWRLINEEERVPVFICPVLEHLLFFRREMLRKWKWNQGLKATYEELLRALIDIESLGVAESVVKLLKGWLNISVQGLIEGV